MKGSFKYWWRLRRSSIWYGHQSALSSRPTRLALGLVDTSKTMSASSRNRLCAGTHNLHAEGEEKLPGDNVPQGPAVNQPKSQIDQGVEKIVSGNVREQAIELQFDHRVACTCRLFQSPSVKHLDVVATAVANKCGTLQIPPPGSVKFHPPSTPYVRQRTERFTQKRKIHYKFINSFLPRRFLVNPGPWLLSKAQGPFPYK
jgi:hypothetical protein